MYVWRKMNPGVGMFVWCIGLGLCVCVCMRFLALCSGPIYPIYLEQIWDNNEGISSS